jgi:hypothetical protein
MKKQENNDISISKDKITLRFDGMEPIVILRSRLGTRLQLVEWIYRLTGWPGMSLLRMRGFIAAVFRHHGWALPEPKDDPLLTEPVGRNESEALLSAATAHA